ncbi:MAG: hypothetical protein WB646_19965 [Steroidobacteraceae bacterium]
MKEDKDDPWGLENTGVTKSRLRPQKPASRFDPYQGVLFRKATRPQKRLA